MAPADADTTWVWSAPLGAYYHATSGTYALPGDGGSGAWTYLSPAELASRGAAAGSSSSSSSSRTSTAPSRVTDNGSYSKLAPPTVEKEDGEVEDDVGWGGLMEPEKLERVMRDTAAASAAGVALRHDRTPAPVVAPGPRYGDEDRHTAYGGKRDDRAERDGYRDRDRDRDRDRVEGDRYGERIRHPVGGDRSNSNNNNDPAARFREWTHSGASTPVPAPPRAADDSTVEEDDAPAPDASPHLLRLVIKRSKHLPLGGVAVLDGRAGGIQLGRDRCERGAPARLRVREMEVSKTHALVYHGVEGGASASACEEDAAPAGWWIVDLGSTLGTYVAHRGERDATRLSAPKCASRPHALRHLSRVTVGTTTAVAHVHDDWPCGECQLSGNVQIALDDGTVAAEEAAAAKAAASASIAPEGARSAERMGRGDREFKRKLEMTALRDTLLGGSGSGSGTDGGGGGGGARAGVPKAAYVDRSAQRRRLHPASPPPRRAGPAAASAAAPAAPVVIVSKPQGPSSASRAMLARQGWSEGQGLGRDGQGRAAPVEVVVRAERAGLGARGQVADVPGGAMEGDWKSRGRQRRWDEVGRGGQ